MKIPDNKDNSWMCQCYTGRCPTYNENTLDSELFCARGKHPKNPQQKKCICPECSVWRLFKLSNLYYCIEGSAEERGGK